MKPWDRWLVEMGREMSVAPQEPDDVARETAVSWMAGAESDDGFGAWSFDPADPRWIMADGEKAEPVEPDKALHDGRFSLMILASGQPDGPGTPGVVWLVRAETRGRDAVEIVRVWGEDLGHVVAVAYAAAAKKA
jgi:hypothetical protein